MNIDLLQIFTSSISRESRRNILSKTFCVAVIFVAAVMIISTAHNHGITAIHVSMLFQINYRQVIYYLQFSRLIQSNIYLHIIYQDITKIVRQLSKSKLQSLLLMRYFQCTTAWLVELTPPRETRGPQDSQVYIGHALLYRKQHECFIVSTVRKAIKLNH